MPSDKKVLDNRQRTAVNRAGMAGKIVIGVWLVVLALAPLPQLGYCEQHDELVGRLVFSHGSGDFQRRKP
jgi:hypothetical protein